MRVGRAGAVVTLGLVLGASALYAQDRSGYRDFQLGGNVPSVAALAKVPPSDAMTLHQRPALIQELTWRLPVYQADSIVPVTDPVREIVFSFYNDQLFRMVVTYDHGRTDGLTDADMIAGVSTSYGPPQKATRPRPGPFRASNKSQVRWSPDGGTLNSRSCCTDRRTTFNRPLRGSA